MLSVFVSPILKFMFSEFDNIELSVTICNVNVLNKTKMVETLFNEDDADDKRTVYEVFTNMEKTFAV